MIISINAAWAVIILPPFTAQSMTIQWNVDWRMAAKIREQAFQRSPGRKDMDSIKRLGGRDPQGLGCRSARLSAFRLLTFHFSSLNNKAII